MDYEIIDFPIKANEIGSMVDFEGNKDIPFDIKSLFYIFDTKGKDITKYNNANSNSKSVLVMLSGSCKVKVFSGDKREVIELDTPSKGLFLNKMVWKEIYDFSDGSVMTVFLSELLDNNECIDTYEEFLSKLNK